MCGISGIYKLDGSVVEGRNLQKMTDIISYRGPNGFGYWYNLKATLGFGHRRLSIIDLTNGGQQPMTYMGLTITFNGEIYNYLEIKKVLCSKGYKFRTESDTEVLLAAYHANGKDCLNDFDGMFSFAIWDENKKELFCARDRFGEKPFYYYKDTSQFVFGSEIKQIWAAGISREVNPAMLHHYCATNALTNINAPEGTFYRGINQLQHRHSMTIKSDGSINIEKYWDITDNREKTILSLEQAAEKFSELLSVSIKRRMRSDVSIGTSLSGGLDSTTIASYICRENSGLRLNTFTASFPGFEKDETRFVSTLKKRYQNINDCYVEPTEEEFVDDLEKLLFHQDEPIGSTSIYAQFKVMQLARKSSVTVLLDGQGADEYLGGYNQFWPVRLRELFKSDYKNYRAEAKRIKKLTGFEQDIDLNLAVMLKYPNLYRKISGLKNTITGKNGAENLARPVKSVYYQLKQTNKNEIDWSNLNEVLYHSTFESGLQNLLRYADRNSMAHSVEVRLPFLNHQLVEFVFSLPSSYKMNGGWSKLLLRKSQTGNLPEKICWRKEKVGYATPQQKWMQNGMIIEMVADAKLKLKKSKMLEGSFIDSVDDWKILNLSKLPL
jgi:asparagine synthase (glutamine-hydrolysing)